MKFVEAILNAIPSIGAIYAKVQGPRAIPNTNPNTKAANKPFFLYVKIGAFKNKGSKSRRYIPMRINITPIR